MKVFVSGSISIKQLPEIAREKLRNIISHGYEVLVGDAKGVDLAVQQYLAHKNYAQVAVYYAGNQVRNRVYPWPVKGIAATGAVRGRALFTLKDIAMAQEADYGLMIWDGKSPGTLNNMREMAQLGKKFVVIRDGLTLSRQDVGLLLAQREMEKETMLL